MGGDQLTQLIIEYISKNGGFIAFVIVLLSIAIIAIAVGITFTIIMKARKPKEAGAAIEAPIENKDGDKGNE